jgi:hypothetical protein
MSGRIGALTVALERSASGRSVGAPPSGRPDRPASLASDREASTDLQARLAFRGIGASERAGRTALPATQRVLR